MRDDHHDGTYSGIIDGVAVRASGHTVATFRVFQRSETFGVVSFAEVVIGMWADGSACEGALPGPYFQSRGGNCFANVSFV